MPDLPLLYQMAAERVKDYGANYPWSLVRPEAPDVPEEGVSPQELPADLSQGFLEPEPYQYDQATSPTTGTNPSPPSSPPSLESQVPDVGLQGGGYPPE